MSTDVDTEAAEGELQTFPSSLGKLAFRPPLPGERIRCWHFIVAKPLDKSKWKVLEDKEEIIRMIQRAIVNYNTTLHKKA